MKTLLIILFLSFYKSVISQTLIPDAVKTKTAYQKLLTDTSNKKFQENYVNAFPSDTKIFLNVFQTKKIDQLSNDSFEYLDALEQCAKTFPTEVVSKCVDIGKNLVWDADAVGQLQHISVIMAVKYVTVFIGKYKTLNIKEQNSLINFFADAENHSAYQEYQDLIDKLNSIGQTKISIKLETARTNRKNRHDH